MSHSKDNTNIKQAHLPNTTAGATFPSSSLASLHRWSSLSTSDPGRQSSGQMAKSCPITDSMIYSTCNPGLTFGEAVAATAQRSSRQYFIFEMIDSHGITADTLIPPEENQCRWLDSPSWAVASFWPAYLTLIVAARLKKAMDLPCHRIHCWTERCWWSSTSPTTAPTNSPSPNSTQSDSRNSYLGSYSCTLS